MKNFKVVFDGYYSAIEETHAEADNIVIFTKLSQAKKRLIESHRRVIDEYRANIREAQRLTNENFKF